MGHRRRVIGLVVLAALIAAASFMAPALFAVVAWADAGAQQSPTMLDWPTLLTPLIIALVPILTILSKKIVPDKYRVLIPVFAVLKGPLLDAAFTWLSQQPANPGRGVLLGMAGVALREIVDQARKIQTGPALAAKTMLALGLAAWTLTACISTGALDPNLGRRLAGDTQCLAAAAAAGLATAALVEAPAAGPAVIAVMGKIAAAGATNVPTDLLVTCSDAFQNAVQDAQGIAAKAKGAVGK
jgi:hypothetical protein